jgi:archaellum component FlaF (FlaF/FlaG flagellin family)
MISRGVVRDDRRDYTGTGFVDLDEVAGSSVEWRVKATTAGRATLTFKYANGSTTTDRPMDIRVNGTLVSPAHPFKYTLSWDEWDTRTVSSNLVAGVNTIRATATSAAGGPNLDNVQVHVTPAPPASPRYEAEDAAITNGAVESNHAGFSGAGFVNYDNVAGSAVQWTVTAAAAGPAGVTIRYANGTAANRPMDVIVNGTVVAAGLAFPGTGGWARWQNRAVTVPLAAGSNTIRATATTAAGGPNVDYLDVASPAR